MDDFKLPPQHPGQARTMLVCDGPLMTHAEVGHWYSPDKVAELIAAEREACAKVCQEQSIRFAEAMNGKAAYGAGECEKAIIMRSNAEVTGRASAACEGPR